MSSQFISKDPTLDDYWRGIILFGRNVASYKFALAKSLLELRPASGSLVKLEDLAPVFASHITEHLKLADKQGTSSTSKFLSACRRFNSGEISTDQLTSETVRNGFNNVIDAFHVVGQSEISKRFYLDERTQNDGIRMTDEFERLIGSEITSNLLVEVEARWRLVETAWDLGITRSLVVINYDTSTESLFAIDRTRRRKSITGSRDALNGYQKGKCFYCSRRIDISNNNLLPDVDHFFPHTLKQFGFGPIVDGVWNLVLACQECNRGLGGKFDRLPTIPLLERLHTRNEYLIASHHPLRETLIQQTGETERNRVAFLNTTHSHALVALLHQWAPFHSFPPTL